MKPSVVLFDERNEQFVLYFGGYSTIDGLRLFEPNGKCAIEVCYFDNGESHVPYLDTENATISEVIDRLESVSVSLVDFSCTIGETSLSSHDDGECHFESNKVSSIRQLFLKAIPKDLCHKIWSLLEANAGKYIRLSSTSEPEIYDTFDAYIGAHKGQ